MGFDGEGAAEWLRGEHLPQAELDARLEADRELYAILKADGFIGPNWDVFANEIARYGLAVIRGWLRSRQIFAKCKEKNAAAPDLPQHVTDDPVAVNSIADEVVALAIVKFRDKVLAQGRWDPDRRGARATLKSFFIGQCLFQYANAARGWLAENANLTRLLTEHELATATPLTMQPSTDDVIREIAAAALRNGASNERAALILALDSQDYSRKEIADELSLTPDTVASVLKRERARLRRTMEDPRKEGSA